MPVLTATDMERIVNHVLHKLHIPNPRKYRLMEPGDLMDFLIKLDPLLEPVQALKECGLMSPDGEFHPLFYANEWVVDVWDHNPGYGDVRMVFVPETGFCPIAYVLTDCQRLLKARQVQNGR